MPPAEAEQTGWTPAGRATVHLVLLASVLALVFRDRVLATTAAVLSLVLAGAVVTLRREIPLVGEITPPPHELRRRERAECVVRVMNVSHRTARRLSVLIQTGEERRTQTLPSLGPAEGIAQPWVISMPFRGDHAIGPVLVERVDLVRLRRRVTPVGAALRVRVYPAEHTASRARTTSVSRPGAAAESPRLGSDSFRSLRTYIRGDDVRHIHWRTTARTGRLMVRELVEQQTRHVALFLDDRTAAMSHADFDEAVDVAASLITAAVDAKLGVDLSTTSTRITVAPGAPVERVRDFLACVTQVAVTGSDAPDGSGRIVITGTGEAAAPARAATTIEIDRDGARDAATAIRLWNDGERG